MKTIKAYFDTVDTVTVEIANTFYEGYTKTLTLQQGAYKEKLEIIESVVGEEITTYYAKISSPINIGEEYEILDDHNLRTNIEYRRIIKQKSFDEMFYYDKNDLGNTYSNEETTFKVWSPIASQILLSYDLNGDKKAIHMSKGDMGVWTTTISGDMEYATYTYLVKVNGIWNEATDPYAYTSTPNTKKSVVIDLKKTEMDLNHDKLLEFKSYTDAIIYELHVRDFSVHPESGIKNKGKFIGVVEEGTKSRIGAKTGIDYLKTLGVTHIQFLPIYDFGSVDELNQFDFYNWGYDPVAYNVPEGSYASVISDPYSRIIDLKTMISKLHADGFRVNMDVVYNHMFDIQTSAFNNIVPGYYFRYGEAGEVSNGSFCGNDVESRALMARKYIVDSVKQWKEMYGIDGFRFDLMGIVDNKTMSLVRESLPREVMVYGEGWHMPTLMDDDEQSSMINYNLIPKIAHFNDRFRDTVKGKTSTDEAHVKGFITGDLSMTDEVVSGLSGSIFGYKEATPVFSEPYQTVNYLECHDNHTLYDKMQISNSDESDDILKRRARLGAFITLVSQGISFIHAGQEFNRTKDGDHNSYISSDKVNAFDWNRLDERYLEVKYVRELIKLRRGYKPFRLDNSNQIREHVSVEKLSNGIIEYKIEDVKRYSDYQEITILINGTKEDFSYELNGQYDVFALDNRASVEPFDKLSDVIVIPNISGAIIMKK